MDRTIWKVSAYSIISFALCTGALLFILKYTPNYFSKSKQKKDKKKIFRRNIYQLEACRDWENVGKVEIISIYPVKSCAGIRKKCCFADKYGLKSGQFMDRSFIITDVETGNMVNGIKNSKVLLITAEIEYKNTIVLQYPHLQQLRVDLSIIEMEGKVVNGNIYGDPFSGFDCGDEASDWLNLALGRRSRLVYNGSIIQNRMHQDLPGANSLFDSEDNCVYADTLPYLLMNEASLKDLELKSGRKIPPQNFRSNIMVAGPVAFDEDDWTYIKIGDAIFRNVLPCDRCTFITIDYDTAKRDKNMEPLKTLRKYRCKSGTTNPEFGINLCVDKTGLIREGDDVFVLRN